MKKCLSIAYWVIAVAIVAAIMVSLQYSVGEAFFIGTLFLPGAIAAKYAFSKAQKKTGSSMALPEYW